MQADADNGSPCQSGFGYRGFVQQRVFWFLCLLGLLCQTALATELSVTSISVGQGDAALIVSPTGKTILVDGGPPEGTERLIQTLKRRQVSSLDLIVLTHPHLDHLGGLGQVVQTLPVRAFLDAGYPSTSPPYAALMKLLSARGIAVKNATAGRNIDIGDGATLTLIGPPSPFLANTRSDVNANSVVVRLSWRGRTALFTGDSEPETEQFLLSHPPAGADGLRAELLKVAHHGGRYSSTDAFLRAVSPKLAFISAGPGNDYGHPTAEAMGRIAAVGATIYRTDLQGDLTAVSQDGQPWVVKVEAAPAVMKAHHGSGPSKLPETPAPAQSTPQPPVPTTPPAAEEGYVASKNSQVFHTRRCPSAERILPANRISFPTRAAAIQSGRQPGGDCKP